MIGRNSSNSNTSISDIPSTPKRSAVSAVNMGLAITDSDCDGGVDLYDRKIRLSPRTTVTPTSLGRNKIKADKVANGRNSSVTLSSFLEDNNNKNYKISNKGGDYDGVKDVSLSSFLQDTHTRLAIEKMKPVSEDLLNRLEFLNKNQNSSPSQNGFDGQASVSELSWCVNDSAGGKSFEEVYERGDVLGEGGFAVVRRCRHIRNGRSYAVKEVRNEDYEDSAENIKEEIDALKRLRDGPYIVRLFDVFHGAEKTHLILEECRGTDLLERLSDREVFPEPESRRISRRLLEAVHFCHRKKICHRDIKLENILVADVMDDTKIKLGDFGCSHRITGPKCLKTLCGSPQYVAPEVYIHEDGYDERCDLWSVGVCIYVFLGGYAPFEGSAYELPEMICQGTFDFHPQYWGEISKAPKELIRRLIVVNPEERASVEEALDSDWLRRRDKESVLKFMGATKGNASSTNTFDAWVRLQNESHHSGMSMMDSSLRSFQQTPSSNVINEVYSDRKSSIPDSIRSLKIDEL